MRQSHVGEGTDDIVPIGEPTYCLGCKCAYVNMYTYVHTHTLKHKKKNNNRNEATTALTAFTAAAATEIGVTDKGTWDVSYCMS